MNRRSAVGVMLGGGKVGRASEARWQDNSSDKLARRNTFIPTRTLPASECLLEQSLGFTRSRRQLNQVCYHIIKMRDKGVGRQREERRCKRE